MKYNKTACNVEKIESPIEDKMLRALASAKWGGVPGAERRGVVDDFVCIGRMIPVIHGVVGVSLESKILSLAPEVVIETQRAIDAYRVDVAIDYTPNILHEKTTTLVVECDGFAYHSDRKALARDATRDRLFRSLGITVMRFSGSDIYRDAHGCARRVAECALSLHTSGWGAR